MPGGTFNERFTYHGNTCMAGFDHTISTFYMAKYETVYQLWYEVRQWGAGNGYTFINVGQEGSYNASIGATPTSSKHQPVTYISWRDMIVWCNAYSQKSGLTPVYYSDAAYATPIKSSAGTAYTDATAGSCDNPYVNWDADGFRLPTLGEWQYAARYIDGNTWTPLTNAAGAIDNYLNESATGLVAWFSANSGGKSQDVGTRQPTALGIYDMSGNMAEWLWDWQTSNWPAGPVTDYRGPAINGQSGRFYFGGDYFYGARDTIVSNDDTNFVYPYGTFANMGFRVVRKY